MPQLYAVEPKIIKRTKFKFCRNLFVVRIHQLVSEMGFPISQIIRPLIPTCAASKWA